jgi:ankyrin repeat protein
MESKALPLHANLDQYKKQAKDLLRAFKAGDPEALERLRRWHPRGPAVGSPTLSDAQWVLARAHAFPSWPKFAESIRDLGQEDSTFAKFEQAADAIVNGNVDALRELLRENSGLVGAQSPREHHATLLHYISANGIEDYRQRTPKNAVEIAAVLLDAGADVDAIADVYGKSTTLGLTATSIHTLRAGVLVPLLELLLARGAAIDGPPGGGRIVNACLANGRKLASEILADKGARLDLEGAAGVGRVDLVKRFFKADGSLMPGATPKQMESGFVWACEYGRAAVAAFLLDAGVDPGTCRQHKLTGLHWAAISGDVNTVEVVLRHAPPLEAQNVWGGTPLGSAVWAALNADPSDPSLPNADWVQIIELLLTAGANVHAVNFPTGHSRIDEVLRRYGARE